MSMHGFLEICCPSRKGKAGTYKTPWTGSKTGAWYVFLCTCTLVNIGDLTVAVDMVSTSTNE